ncbi:MAG: aspartate/glutamate racemase family protein [Calditrichaeota bacterium]|nr:aspartate/glutamate racemase family protein [Calditrichota bacterium]
MKTLGLIGGTTWHSTVDYYRQINELVNERLGGSNAARLILYSVNFREFYDTNHREGWPGIERLVCDIARKLEAAGAEGLILCANTPHIVADALQASVRIPLIHIAEATAAEIKKAELSRVLLLGTGYTMELPFYKDILAKNGIETVVPDKETREWINTTIFDELAVGIFKPETKAEYVRIMRDLKNQEVEGVILGCTEIPVLIQPEECPLPAFDTIEIHAKAAVEWMLT